MSVRAKQCGGCGLFSGHVEGCNGYTAVYMRYMHEGREDGFQTIADAEAFLGRGESAGSLASVSVVAPDGTVVRSREELGYSWPDLA